jgi:hypothetical protein
VDLKPHLQRLGPLGGYELAGAVLALEAIARWVGFSIALVLLAAFGEH